jgi:hypothetical protein
VRIHRLHCADGLSHVGRLLPACCSSCSRLAPGLPLCCRCLGIVESRGVSATDSRRRPVRAIRVPGALACGWRAVGFRDVARSASVPAGCVNLDWPLALYVRESTIKPDLRLWQCSYSVLLRLARDGSEVVYKGMGWGPPRAHTPGGHRGVSRVRGSRKSGCVVRK